MYPQIRLLAVSVAPPTVPTMVVAEASTSPMTGAAFVPPVPVPTSSYEAAPATVGWTPAAEMAMAAPVYLPAVPAIPTLNVLEPALASQYILPPITRAPGGSLQRL